MLSGKVISMRLPRNQTDPIYTNLWTNNTQPYMAWLIYKNNLAHEISQDLINSWFWATRAGGATINEKGEVIYARLA